MSLKAALAEFAYTLRSVSWSPYQNYAISVPKLRLQTCARKPNKNARNWQRGEFWTADCTTDRARIAIFSARLNAEATCLEIGR